MLKQLFTLLAGVVTIKDCGNKATDQAIITGFGFFPLTPSPDEKTELWVAYDLKSAITGGTATYTYSFNGIPFSPTVDDLCSQTNCPKLIGTYNETSDSNFPSGLSGKVITSIEWANQNNDPVWCVELTFKI
jgi:hypothetical protein